MAHATTLFASNPVSGNPLRAVSRRRRQHAKDLRGISRPIEHEGTAVSASDDLTSEPEAWEALAKLNHGVAGIEDSAIVSYLRRQTRQTTRSIVASWRVVEGGQANLERIFQLIENCAIDARA